MNYEKPRIALVCSALEVVQSQASKEGFLFDGVGYVTEAAYEADE